MRFRVFLLLVLCFFLFRSVIFAEEEVTPTPPGEITGFLPPVEPWVPCIICEFPFSCDVSLTRGPQFCNTSYDQCTADCCSQLAFCDEEQPDGEKCQLAFCCADGKCNGFSTKYNDECQGEGTIDNGARPTPMEVGIPPVGVDLWLTVCGDTYPAWVWGKMVCEEWLSKNDGHCYAIEPTPMMKFYNECNGNEPIPGEPLPGETLPVDPFLPIARCIASSYPETDPMPECIVNNTCWEKPSVCATNCQMFWYCDETAGSCRNGFFKDIGACNMAHPMGCHLTMDQCFDVCSCGTGNNCGATTCVGEFCDNGCGGWDEGTMVCAPELVPFIPSGDKIEIGDGGMNLIDLPADGRVHICDSQFWMDPVNNPNQAYFKVIIGDQVSAQNIDVIALGFSNSIDGDDLIVSAINLSADNGSGLGMILSKYGNGSDDVDVVAVTENLSESPEVKQRTMTFLMTYDETFPTNLNYVWVSAMDVYGNTLPWTYTDAGFKYWDCDVDFEGKLYDDSESETVSCPVSGWETEASDSVNFTSLVFKNVGDTEDTVSASIVDNSFSGSGLMWGKTYLSDFNEDINCDITSVLARLIDLTGSVGTTSCMANSQVNTVRKYDLTIPEYSIDPFVDNPRVQLDYSIAQFADPWYQVVGGDLRALGSIGNYVRSPMQMVVGAEGKDAGWIAAGGAFSAGNNDDYSESGWMTENQSGIFGSRIGYDYLYSELKLKKGIGSTAINWSDVGGTGVYFVDGNLTIDSNNTILGAGEYRIIVVNGAINIDSTVSNLYGVFIADGNINITGTSTADAQLIVKGMMYSKGNIVMSRGFDTTSLNNSQAATVLEFDPNLIFNMPPAVFKVMSDWRQGPR